MYLALSAHCDLQDQYISQWLGPFRGMNFSINHRGLAELTEPVGSARMAHNGPRGYLYCWVCAVAVHVATAHPHSFVTMLRSLTHLVSVLSLVLLLGQEVLSHGLSSHDISFMEQALHSVKKRALDGYYVIDDSEGSSVGCSEEQIVALAGFINEARQLASIASKALEKKGSEKSPAYALWFGRTLPPKPNTIAMN